MKPETLLLKNFGPFYGEHKADFSALGDFFLICGETGAGKTTIFDGISYAFYGEAPGSRKGLSKQMRSQYAENEDESYVELVFSMGKTKWKIKRTLPYEKLGIRSKKTQTVPEEVSLEMLAGSQWRNESCTNKNETDKKILSLIKLSADEFSRIVLLPQGEFSRFLRQSSEERKEILSKLFPVSIYREAAETAKEKTKEAETIIDGIGTKISALRTEFNPETFDTEKNTLEKRLHELKEKYSSCQKMLIEKFKLLETAKRIAKNIKELNELEEEYEREIKSKNNLYEEWEKQLSDAEKAAPVAALISQHKTNKKILEENKEKYQEKKMHFDLAEIECRKLETESKNINGQRQKLNELIQREPLIEAAVKAAGEIKESEKSLKEFENKLKNGERILQESESKLKTLEENLEEAAKEKINIEILTEDKTKAESNYESIKNKCGATLEYLQKKEKTEKNKDELDKLFLEIERKEEEKKKADTDIIELRNKYNEQKNHDMAAALASVLKDSEPCPVCGSLHHPSPAVKKTDKLLFYENKILEMEAKRNKLEQELKEIREIHTKTNADYMVSISYLKNQEEKGQIFLTKEEAEKNKTLAEKEMKKKLEDYFKAKNQLNLINELQTEKEKLEKEAGEKIKENMEIEKAISTRRVEIKNMKTRFNDAFPGKEADEKEAELALAFCRSEKKRLQDSISSFEERDKKARNDKSMYEGSMRELETLCLEMEKKTEESEKNLKKEYLSAGFTDYADAEKAVMTREEKEALTEKASSFKQKKMEIENRISFLENQLEKEGGKENRISEDEAEMEYRNAGLLLEENKTETEKINIELVTLKGKMQQWKSLLEEQERKTNELSVLKKVTDDLLGKNPNNIKFEAWILNKYLEEVTEYANMRIGRMSNDRYRIQTGSTFRRGNAMTGLDLEIFDSYTGKTRPTGTLSGGETFMASISLALGLADSIQSRAGGIQLEAVFIDEGFGSLDESCLELAMNIFDEIRGHRMVGIISHVKDLQDRIPSKLEVKKKTEGSYIQQKI